MPTDEEQIRTLIERWAEAVHGGDLDGVAAKDLDGLMAAIADDVVSHEHVEPLQYVGVEAVREVCRRGLDAGDGAAVSWDVPDLRILVSADLAVAWGLNRIRVEQPDGQTFETWSRGTRVFERRDGEWLMTHQHLSVPQDPTTGGVRADLRP